MKKTDLLRKERDLKKARKKIERLDKSSEKVIPSVGDYIKQLHELFFHDDCKIYNIAMSEEILELVEEMKEDLDEKQCENVLRKAVKKCGIKEKEQAFNELKALMA